jgi:hypothetical protein
MRCPPANALLCSSTGKRALEICDFGRTVGSLVTIIVGDLMID